MKRIMIVCLCLAVWRILGAQPVLAQEKEASSGQQKIIPTEIRMDRNHDGKVDRLEVYDKSGVIIRVEADSNGDGKMNEWVFFKKGIRERSERDNNGDGKADTYIKYDDKGNITTSESDTTGDGKINEWVFYKGGKLERAEKDTNADGKADTWIKY